MEAEVFGVSGSRGLDCFLPTCSSISRRLRGQADTTDRQEWPICYVRIATLLLSFFFFFRESFTEVCGRSVAGDGVVPLAMMVHAVIFRTYRKPYTYPWYDPGTARKMLNVLRPRCSGEDARRRTKCAAPRRCEFGGRAQFLAERRL